MPNETRSQPKPSLGHSRALQGTSFILRFPDALAWYLEEEAERRQCAMARIVAEALDLYRQRQPDAELPSEPDAVVTMLKLSVPEQAPRRGTRPQQRRRRRR